MRIYDILKKISERIYRFIKCLEESKKQEEQDAITELLNELLVKEEDYLDSLSERDLKDLLEYMREFYNYHLTATVFELNVQEKYSPIEIRIYQRVKEFRDRKKMTPLTNKEMESIGNKLYSNKLKIAINSLKELDFEVMVCLPEREKEKYCFLLTSLNTPYQLVKKRKKFTGTETQPDYEFALGVIKPYLFSMVKFLLFHKDQAVKEKMSDIFTAYLLTLDAYQEEIVLYFESKLCELKKHIFIPEKNIDEVNQILSTIDFPEIREDLEEVELPEEYIEFMDYTKKEVLYYDEIFKTLYNISKLELQEYTKMKNPQVDDTHSLMSKINLERFNKEREKIFAEVIDLEKLLNYINIVIDSYEISLPFELLKCANILDNPTTFQEENLIRRIIADRTRKLILKQTEVQAHKKIEEFDIEDADILVEERDEELEMVGFILSEEERIFDKILTDLEYNYYYFLQRLSALNKNNAIYRNAILLFEYQNTSPVPKIEDNVLSGANYNWLKNSFIYLIESAYQDLLTMDEESADMIFMNYLNLFESYLLKEDFLALQQEYLSESRKKELEEIRAKRKLNSLSREKKN